jgi:hypothetical protein
VECSRQLSETIQHYLTGDWAKQNHSQDAKCISQNLNWVGRKNTDDYAAGHSMESDHGTGMLFVALGSNSEMLKRLS